VLICHCRAVNDRVVREVAASAEVRSPEDLAALCGAGGRCGGCLPALRALLDELDAHPPVPVALPARCSTAA
jgi:bacterioferritin-associated ferredoxin